MATHSLMFQCGATPGAANDNGYIVVSNGHPSRVGTTQNLEHRIVMEKKIGRALTDKETVHHRNGIRSDNRPSNLELWSTRHPKGSRVEDLLEFAHEIIRDYGDNNNKASATARLMAA